MHYAKAVIYGNYSSAKSDILQMCDQLLQKPQFMPDCTEGHGETK